MFLACHGPSSCWDRTLLSLRSLGVVASGMNHGRIYSVVGDYRSFARRSGSTNAFNSVSSRNNTLRDPWRSYTTCVRLCEDRLETKHRSHTAAEPKARTNRNTNSTRQSPLLDVQAYLLACAIAINGMLLHIACSSGPCVNIHRGGDSPST